MKTYLSRSRAFLCGALLLTILAGGFPPPGAAFASAERAVDGTAVYLPLMTNQYPWTTIHYTNPVEYTVTKGAMITNDNYNLTSLRLYVPYPTDWDNQEIEMAHVGPGGYHLGFETTFGNGILSWTTLLSAPAKGQSISYQESFVATVYQVEAQIFSFHVKPYDTGSPLYTLYTRSENYLEASDPLIIQAMQAAVGGETNAYEKARLIYQYTIDHVEYQLVGGLNGAKETLELGYGECGDYSSVFVAMARAAGIPARPVVGYRAYSGQAYHVWAEFYLQDIGWVPVDATDGESAGWEAFGKLDSARITLSKGYNVPYDLNRVASLFQTYFWGYTGNGTGLTASDIWIVEP